MMGLLSLGKSLNEIFDDLDAFLEVGCLDCFRDPLPDLCADFLCLTWIYIFDSQFCWRSNTVDCHPNWIFSKLPVAALEGGALCRVVDRFDPGVGSASVTIFRLGFVPPRYTSKMI